MAIRFLTLTERQNIEFFFFYVNVDNFLSINAIDVLRNDLLKNFFTKVVKKVKKNLETKKFVVPLQSRNKTTGFKFLNSSVG